ncbi:MAG: carbamoyltransferase HypF [Candidatus Bathyarchaeota archaeon]|nr:MAG: carbamoyltransferase HypF [Candidatus Bathyarchaeota archaeon]
MAEKRAVISVSGLVQGIGFRPFVYRLANRLGLKGYVKNLGDAGVRIDVSGDESAIKRLLTGLVEEKIPLAVYNKIDVDWREVGREYVGFTIDVSDIGTNEVKHSLVPPDVSICPDCLSEMYDPRDRHYLYPFTCCALCGPRFTTIVGLPYDRERTTMIDFPLCDDCGREFYDSMDRRFNAQTICDPLCGPRMTLYHPDGSIVQGNDSLTVAARLLNEGSIVAVKGIGGIHLATKTTDDDPLLILRERRRKPGKPFAVMSPDLENAQKFALITETEREHMTSLARPIVALRKREPFPLSPLISPGLHTVGVMLPYSGIHHLLFHHIDEPALVMTSANYPGEPMFVSNDVAFRKLEGVADYFLLHDRRIHARCDDSVLRVIDDRPLFLRRSRGYVPLPISLPYSSNGIVVAVGSELTSTAAILKEDKCYITQHLGDIESPESLDFLFGAVDHLSNLLRVGKPEFVACDLHPNFLSRTVAAELADDSGADLVEVQHHHAHLVSLMADAGVEPEDDVVGIVCDGYGYGSDGSSWGGEVLVGGYEGFSRKGHLEPQPMPGGDLCVLRYGRMLQGVLYGELPRERLERVLSESCIDGFLRGETEVESVFEQLEKGINTPLTTSAGRLLDAVSCLLGASSVRTYEGEGAMKLEALAASGRLCEGLPIDVDRDGGSFVLRTSKMVSSILAMRADHRRYDLAYTFQNALAEGLAEMAITMAKEHGLDVVGFTGGVANNDMITRVIHRRVEEEGCRFLSHRQVPCGDGGLSLGQAAIASRSL